MKLCYWNYETLSDAIDVDCRALKQEYESFIECLKKLEKNGVQSGGLHEEIAIYISYVSKVPGLVLAICGKTKALIASYLADLNRAQQCDGEYILYEKDYVGTRDYTEEAFQRMRSQCDSMDEYANVFDRFEDLVEDLIYNILKFLGKTFSLWNAHQTRTLVMDINDFTRSQLSDMQDNLYTQEAYYHQNAESLLECVTQLKAYISTLNNAVSTSVEKFSMKPFALRLDEMFTSIWDALDDIYVDAGISWKAVDKFIHTDDAEKFFDKYKVIITEFLVDLSAMDNLEIWKIGIIHMFDIALKETMGWIRSLFGDEYDYEDYLYDNEMMELFNEMAQTKTFEESEYETILTDFEEFMGLLEKYGDGWEKYLTGIRDEKGNLLLDKRTKNYQYFKEFFKQFGDAENILKYGGDVVHLLAAVTADYEKNLEILNVVIDDCDPNSEMAESLGRIRLRYESCLGNAAAVVKEQLSEHSVDAAKALLKNKKLQSTVFKCANVINVVGWVELSIDVVAEVTGLGEKTLAELQLMNLGWDQIDSAEQAYKNALEQVNNCDPNSEEYRKKLDDFAVSFEYYRLTLQRLFGRMATASSGDQKRYYQYCTEHLNNLTIENYESFQLETYEEYIAA